MRNHSSRRTFLAAAVALAAGSAATKTLARQGDLPENDGSAEAQSGITLTWEDPWIITQDQPYSLILDAGSARFALVSTVKQDVDERWDTPQELRDLHTATTDASDFRVLLSLDDESGSHALTFDENTDKVRFYSYWAIEPDFLMEIGFYAPLSKFVEAWNTSRQTIALDDVPVFEGYDEATILAPVLELINAPAIDSTPIANEADRDYLSAVWAIHDALKASSDGAHTEFRGSYDPYGDELLNANQQYVDVWTEQYAAAGELRPPSSSLQALDDTLIACVSTFNHAALLFAEIYKYEDMARSAAKSEFYGAWDDADDLLRDLGDELALWETP